MKKYIPAFLASLLTFGACSPKTGTDTIADETPAATTLAHPDWARNAVIYEVNTRQYTPEGTFKAFQAQLPRLKDLGVDILWFMPIHPISELNRKGGLGSYYAVADYKGVNPEFGTMDDFKELVDSAHAAGMKVIIDWVPNHTGCDNAWVTEHPERYARNDKGEMFGPYDWTDVYKLDYSNPGTREAMTDALTFWLREAGIDGFRCDVAMEVPVDFWNEVRPKLDEAAGHPVFMLAEASQPSLQEHAFDMGYNWPMKDLFSEIAATSGEYSFAAPGSDKPRTFATKHAADIDSLLAGQAASYPTGTILMNMITNHDLNSWEGTEFERLGKLTPAFAVLSYTLPGMPLIYTGQETGLNRAFEFFIKDTAPEWEPRNTWFDFYQRLNSLKHSRTELAAGHDAGALTSFATESPDVYVFERRADSKATVVAVNLGPDAAPVKFTGVAPGTKGAVNAITGEAASLPASLESGQYIILTIN